MNALFDTLVPLTGAHFPGWPAADQPSVVQELIVLFGIPLAIGAVITLIVLSGTLIRHSRGGHVQLEEPLWLGQTSGDKEFATQTARGALTRGGHPLETSTGGASVRW